MKCKICKATAVVALKSHNAAFCADCYREFFARQVERGIRGAPGPDGTHGEPLFHKGERILVALSGGKDSLALMLELSRQGHDVTGRERLRRPVCSVCGKIKRHVFNRAALDGGFDALATGHNLDDEVARLFSNTLRWDTAYLSDQGPLLPAEPGFARKVKPLWRLTEFETANYAFLMGIEHHHAPCPYSPGASFTTLKGVLQGREAAMPGRKLDFYQGFLARGKAAFARRETECGAPLAPCARCGSPTSSGELCGVCRIRQAVAEGGA